MKTTTFLTFVGEQCGKGLEAVKFYVSIFPNSRIIELKNYLEGDEGGTPELIKYGQFSLNGVTYMFAESNFEHAFQFGPAISFFVECDSLEHMKVIFQKLSSSGKVYVPLDDYGSSNYGFGSQFAWCEDKYGVSWQLNFSG